MYHLRLYYQSFLIALMVFKRPSQGMVLSRLVGPRLGGAAAVAARAMVAGMAMAPLAPPTLDIGCKIPSWYCVMPLLETSGGAPINSGEVKSIGDITKTYTPLLTEGPEVKPIAYNTSV